jgi:hypothetical protein
MSNKLVAARYKIGRFMRRPQGIQCLRSIGSQLGIQDLR